MKKVYILNSLVAKRSYNCYLKESPDKPGIFVGTYDPESEVSQRRKAKDIAAVVADCNLTLVNAPGEG